MREREWYSLSVMIDGGSRLLLRSAVWRGRHRNHLMAPTCVMPAEGVVGERERERERVSGREKWDDSMIKPDK